MRGTRIATTAVVLCTVVAGAGCGGDDGGSDGDYAKEYTAVTQNVAKQMEALQSQTSTDPTKLGSQLRSVADALGAAASDIAGIEPPDNAKAGHTKVQAGVKALADDVRSSADALADASSPSGAATALGKLASSKGAAQIQAGEQELRQSGYKVQ